MERQHGRAGCVLLDPILEAKRLYHNLKAKEHRDRLKKMEKEILNYGKTPDLVEDSDGISIKDTRRYKNCFVGIPVDKTYVKRMTGLSDYQITILEQRTGYTATDVLVY